MSQGLEALFFYHAALSFCLSSLRCLRLTYCTYLTACVSGEAAAVAAATLLLWSHRSSPALLQAARNAAEDRPSEAAASSRGILSERASSVSLVRHSKIVLGPLLMGGCQGKGRAGKLQVGLDISQHCQGKGRAGKLRAGLESSQCCQGKGRAGKLQAGLESSQHCQGKGRAGKLQAGLKTSKRCLGKGSAGKLQAGLETLQHSSSEAGFTLSAPLSGGLQQSLKLHALLVRSKLDEFSLGRSHKELLRTWLNTLSSLVASGS